MEFVKGGIKMQEDNSNTQDNNGGNGSSESEEILEPESIEKDENSVQESKAEPLEPEVVYYEDPFSQEDEENEEDDAWEEDEDS